MKKGIKITLKESQLLGAVLVVLTALVIPALLGFYRACFSTPPVIPFGDACKKCIAVEVAGVVESKGIYFIPKGKTFSDLLTILSLNRAFRKSEPLDQNLSRPLPDAVKVTVVQGKSGHPQIEIGEMKPSTRLELNRPLEVNRASLQDLILVPGIGEKTALKIIEARKKAGRFLRLEDMMNVKGIKQKRLEKMRPYLYVEDL